MPNEVTAKVDGARLSQAQVFRIAAEPVTKLGYRLADYQFTRKDKTWSVFYDGKVPTPGNHFLVVIDVMDCAASGASEGRLVVPTN